MAPSRIYGALMLPVMLASKLLNKQWSWRWFETSWCLYNVAVMWCFNTRTTKIPLDLVGIWIRCFITHISVITDGFVPWNNEWLTRSKSWFDFVINGKPCHVMSCHVMSCHVMPCHAMPMPMSCHIKFKFILIRCFIDIGFYNQSTEMWLVKLPTIFTMHHVFI